MKQFYMSSPNHCLIYSNSSVGCVLGFTTSKITNFNAIKGGVGGGGGGGGGRAGAKVV